MHSSKHKQKPSPYRSQTNLSNTTLNLLVSQGPVSTTYLHLWSMRQLPLLAPQWLQSDRRGRGRHSPLTDCNHGSPHSQLQGEVEIPKHEERTCLQGLSMTEDAVIRIDRNNSAEHVHLYPTRDGTRRWSANRAHPTVRTLGSYGSILQLALKTNPPSEGIAPELWNSPVRPHGSRSERVVSPPPLPHWYPAILLAGMVPHLPSSTRP
jgi:hypothetical protein